MRGVHRGSQPPHTLIGLSFAFCCRCCVVVLLWCRVVVCARSFRLGERHPAEDLALAQMGKPFAPVVYPQEMSPSRLPKGGGGGYSSCITAVFCLVRRWFVGARKAAVGLRSTGCSRIGSGEVRANCKYGPDSRPKRRAVPPPGGDAQGGTECRVSGMVKSCAPELFMQPRVCALVPLGLGLEVRGHLPVGTQWHYIQRADQGSTHRRPPVPSLQGAQDMCSHQVRAWPL